MSGISSGVGLFSGIDFTTLTDSLISVQRLSVVRLEQRVAQFQSKQTGIATLEANLLTLNSSFQSLGLESTFETFSVSQSDKTQFVASADSTAIAGTTSFQTIQTASTFESLSRGYANADTQTVGAGTLEIANGGGLHQPTRLDVLNGGAGIRRGTIQITDRSGVTAEVNLENAFTVEDVLNAINNSDAAVTAYADGDKLVLNDTSGSTANALSVIDLNGGHAAADLGIASSVAANTLTGSTIFSVTEDFTLEFLNDGNGLRLLEGAPDLEVGLTDGTTFQVTLDDAATLSDVIGSINGHVDNGGKVTAALVNGHLELTDNTAGGGSFALTEINDSSVLRQLGLDVAAVGNSITGNDLVSGLNSVLLRNLRGGQGITQTGSISLTNRAGLSTTVDLTNATSLDDVLNAITQAEDGGTSLQLTARENDIGTGLVIEDLSGGVASNLIIADVGGSTLAAELGITIDAAATEVDSGSLGHRYVNEATGLSNYAPDGNSFAPGSILITDSAGNSAEVEISSAVENVGDVLQRINVAAGIQVSAELNATGDGFVIIDQAGGAGELTIAEVDSTTAADLRILGTADAGEITSRLTTVITIAADDTLTTLAEKINSSGDFAEASILQTGTTFNSFRLSLRSSESGEAGHLFIDDGDLGLNFSTQAEAQDALLRVGDNPATGYIRSSSTNTITDAVTGVDLQLLEAGSSSSTITLARDTARVEAALSAFVDSYNTLVNSAEELTKFNVDTNERGVLQGSSVVSRVFRRLESIILQAAPSSSVNDTVRTLFDVGINVGEGGKLSLDSDRLSAVLTSHPDAVSNFFLADTTGFSERAVATLESLTDPFTGSLTLEDNALQDSVDSLNVRITQLDEILDVRRTRLLRQFINMETTLATLNSQQEAITALSSLASTVRQNSSNSK